MNNVDILTGEKGRYQIKSPLNKGGQAHTYIAENINSKEKVVIKEFQNSQQNNNERFPEIEKQFKREAKTLNSLNDNGLKIPQLIETSPIEHNNSYCIVQELIPGATLQEELDGKIRRGENFSEEDVIDILRQTLEILQDIHKEQIIHRDIKPSNLIRHENGHQIYLIDFGLAKKLDDSQVGSSSFCGSPGYIPLEQTNGNVQFNSDIYSLGITAIQLLTMKKNPDDLNRNERNQVINNIYEHEEWKGLSITSKLRNIIEKMVQRNYNNRYQNAGQVLKELDKFNQQSPDLSPNWIFIFVAFLLSNLTGILMGFLLFGETEPEPPVITSICPPTLAQETGATWGNKYLSSEKEDESLSESHTKFKELVEKGISKLNQACQTSGQGKISLI